MGSSGGGSSGAVTHSVYLESVHADWLNTTGVDKIEKSITEVMDTALGNSPWVAQAAYNPAALLAANDAVLVAFKAILAGIVDTTKWVSFFTQAQTSIGAVVPLVVADRAVADATEITDAAILLDVAAMANTLDDEITIKVLPRFRRGMQDINAVVSSAFPIGESIIEGFRDRDVAKHDSALRVAAAIKNAEVRISNMTKETQVGLANLSKDLDIGKINLLTEAEYKKLYLDGTSQILNLLINRVNWEDGYVKMFVEANRISIVALKEQTDSNHTIDELDAKWDLEVFQFGANVMAASAGGTSSPGIKGPSKMQSVLGGAMSGAAAGAMIGSAAGGVGAGPGAVIGGVLGAAAGLLS